MFIISLLVNRIKKGTFKLSFFYENKNIKVDITNDSKISFWFCLIIIILWIIEDSMVNAYKSNFTDLDFWMLELLILTYLNSIICKQQIYKHQKLSIYINLVICMVKILLIYLSSINKEENGDDLYLKYEYFIPVLIVIYLILITLRSFINIKLKILMAINYINPIEILIIYGFMGALIHSIFCIVTTFAKCTSSIKELFCKVPYNGTDLYLDSYTLYYEELIGNINNNYSIKEIIIEIFLVFFGIIFNFIYKFYYISIINYLSPMHLIFSYSINNIIPKIILPINTLIYEGTFFSKNAIEYNKMKYIFGILMNIFSIFTFSIYLEIIQFNFCGFNKNLKESIMKRASEDIDMQFLGDLGDLEDKEENDNFNENKNDEENENFNENTNDDNKNDGKNKKE